MYNIDDKDMKIIEVLKKDSRLSTQAISKKTLIPITTVHNRIRKLTKTKVIDGFTLRLNEEKLGNFISAYVLATVEYPKSKKGKDFQQSIAKKIKSFPEVRWVSILAGKTDIILFTRIKSMDALNSFILEKLRTIEGIDKTETMVVMKEF